MCLDVGETLIDETRVWSLWADELGISRLTFLAAFGAVIARGGEHRGVFEVFGVDDWEERRASVEAAYGGFREEDLYPDARRGVDALRAAGYRVAIVANQPASRSDELRALGIHAEVLAMSDEMGVHKPDPAFFTESLRLMGDPDPSTVAYVGDRIDNDVIPAAAAGMRAVWLRRGPWGVIHAAPTGVEPALTVDSLDELVGRIGDVWTPAAGQTRE